MFRNTKLALACSLAMGSLGAVAAANAVTPTISSSSLSSTTLTINGSNLSGGAATVTLGGTGPLAVQSQTATQLTVALPASLLAGDYSLTVQIGTKGSSTTTSVVTVGAVGPQGPAGPVGPQGPQGATGATGAQGLQGDTGPQGDQGPAAPQGPAGPQGPKGDTGPQGAQGPTGPTGATGAQGPKGDIGATGAQGDQGPAGPTGAQGSKGDTGDQGPQGLQGATGPAGPQGPQGPMGPPGGPALSLLDANGTAVGTIYGPGNTWGAVFVLATIGTERIVLPFGWSNNDETGNVAGPELNVGTLGWVSYESTDCSGQPYVARDWGPAPGSTKPAAIFQAGSHFQIFLGDPTVPMTIDVHSIYYPGPPGGSIRYHRNAMPRTSQQSMSTPLARRST